MSERTYITLPRSQRVEDYLEHGQSLAIMAAFANAALAMRSAQEDWIDQLWIASATWGLDLWEALVGIVPAADATLGAATMVWQYVGQMVFNMLILTGLVRGSDRIVKEMFNL